MTGLTDNKFALWAKKPIFWILLGALLVRVLVVFYLGNVVSGLSGAHDEISYSMLGQRYAAGYGLTFPSDWYPWIKANMPQSYYSATMSLYLAAIYMGFGYYPLVARLITALLSVLVVGMIYLLAGHLFDEKVALLSALIAAGYAYLVFYGVTLVTETPFILCILVALYLAYQIVESPSLWKWAALGLALAISVLFRMAVILFVPILLAWVALRQPQKRLFVLFPIVMIFLAVLPFTLRNYSLWGRFLLLESQFGHVFWNGNHPDHRGNFHPYRVFPIAPDVLASQNDAEITNRLFWMAVQNVLNDPVHFMLLTNTRLRELFKFWPTSDSIPLANLLRVFSFGIMWPFAVAGLLLSRRRWHELIPLWLFMLIHIGVYSISWTMIRYRIPLDAILIPFAALALVTVFKRFGSTG